MALIKIELIINALKIFSADILLAFKIPNCLFIENINRTFLITNKLIKPHDQFQQEDCSLSWQSELTPYGYCITFRPPQKIDTYGITGKIIDLSFTIRYFFLLSVLLKTFNLFCKIT